MDIGSKGFDSKGWRAAGGGALFGGVILLLGACGDESSGTSLAGNAECDLDRDLLVQNLAPNAIPAVTYPTIVSANDPAVDYLSDEDRVLGVVIEGQARAYPHNILWHHEIVNDQIGDTEIAVTFCPLTGSGLAFDPNHGGDLLDLGVSGFLFANNLVLYDRISTNLYGPQLGVEGKCSTFRDSALDLMAVQEMSWGRWKRLHPDTEVMGNDQGFFRDYQRYPYGDYDRITDESLLFSMVVDRSRPIKERVLAIRSGDGGRGYPYGELAELGEFVALNETVAGIPTAVFFEAREGWSALAFDARVDGEALTFDAVSPGTWADRETGSTWTLDGRAVSGLHTGATLTPRADAYTLFWFAWKHFQPNGETFGQ